LETPLVKSEERTTDWAEIANLLQPIVGQPLTDMWRPIGQGFEFGPQTPTINRRGEAVHRAPMLLDLLDRWHITRGSTIVMGYADHVHKRRFYHRQKAPAEAEARARWVRAKEFFEHVSEGSLIVRAVQGRGGGLEIELSGDYWIRAFVDGTDVSDVLYFRNDLTGESIMVSMTMGNLDLYATSYGSSSP
jgi:hypothetical protein